MWNCRLKLPSFSIEYWCVIAFCRQTTTSSYVSIKLLFFFIYINPLTEYQYHKTLSLISCSGPKSPSRTAHLVPRPKPRLVTAGCDDNHNTTAVRLSAAECDILWLFSFNLNTAVQWTDMQTNATIMIELGWLLKDYKWGKFRLTELYNYCHK